ncbi:pilus assembly FimT family protein [Desulforhopalus singaporensis]|uniref:N-terminal methylation site-containing protein n=1 Tax=Desulforhopalus singaporensis TaxID=91360 RepID=A0A1H0M1V2_9BACT|nr:prepilin-type N-terminal cleavage/methylation domain-containing protein [Desulforhopalus singaporensis]SDO74387.1 N-terminal methylation site-containing protein [Desulforhopalus singaporensis]
MSTTGKLNSGATPVLPPLVGDDDNMWREKGFTLMELVVVCAIIGIMLSIVVPAMRGFVFGDPLKTSSRKLIGYVAEARSRSIRLQKPYILYISQLENRLSYEPAAREETDAETGETAREFKLPDSVSISEIWVEGESGVEGKLGVWINEQGYMNQTMIQLQDDAGESVTLHFHTFLDTVSITDDFTVPGRSGDL